MKVDYISKIWASGKPLWATTSQSDKNPLSFEVEGKCYAINNGSGCTGCGAYSDQAKQMECKFRALKDNGTCMHICMEEYCDNPVAQAYAKGRVIS